MDGLLFTALKQQLDIALRNTHIQRVFQSSTYELCVQLRGGEIDQSLFISIDPALPTVHVRDGCPKAKTTSWAQAVQKHLIPGRILHVRQDPFERVLHFDIEGRDDVGVRTCRTLTVEILGQLSNVILSYSETGIIIEAMRHMSGTNRSREIVPGVQYVPPDQTGQTPPDNMDYEGFDRLLRLNPEDTHLTTLLSRNILGVSPFAARELVTRLQLPLDCRSEHVGAEDRRRLWELITHWAQKCKANDVEPTALRTNGKIEYWLFPILAVSGDSLKFDTLSQLLQWSYDWARLQKTTDELKRRLRSICKTELKRVSKKAKLQEKAIQDGKNADTYRMYGDLIMAQLHLVKPKQDRVMLPHLFENGQPIEIVLDPSLTPVENATRYYKSYQKANSTVVKAQKHLNASMAEKTYIESVLHMIDVAETIEDLRDVEAELTQSGYIQSNRHKRNDRQAGEASQPLRFRSSDGLTIYVGKNNRQNDMLTMRTARPHDFWLHVKEIPGAHVIIQSEGRRELPERTIWEAAHLAAYYSKAKDSGSVPVDITERRYVHKPKGARPGMVLYENERTLYVTPDPEMPVKLSVK